MIIGYVRVHVAVVYDDDHQRITICTGIPASPPLLLLRVLQQ